MFQGELYIEMRWYDCGFLQKAFEHFISLNLPFPSTEDRVYTLDEWLEEYIRSYQPKSKNAFYWESCEDRTSYMKTVYFYKIPKVLVLRVDRFGTEIAERRHNLTQVDFNHKSLQLYDYWYLQSSKKTEYELNALVEHSGMVTNNNFQWYFRDDGHLYKYYGHSRIEKVKSFDSDCCKYAYVFFYTHNS